MASVKMLITRFSSLALHRKPYCRRKCHTFTSQVTNPINKNQIYISQSRDPFLNLSIEHYILEKSSAGTTVLFIYTNCPSIILGRNQNPWNEINIGLLREKLPCVNIVRRRSGGGTVFHDEGNVNYSVISPSSGFDRNKHLKMVVSALEELGVEKVRVNERHDIVIDKVEPGDGSEEPYKISGSAYKLTKFRSLHHGTCLLESPNLKAISKFLEAPAKTFIKARGVDSVRSRITNVEKSKTAFQKSLVEQFSSIYSVVTPVLVDNELEKIPEIFQGIRELKSNEWIYGQTPQFTFSIDSDSKFPDDPSKTIGEAWEVPSSFHEEFTARNGRIKNTSALLSPFLNRNVHEIIDWRIKNHTGITHYGVEIQEKIQNFLNHLFSTVTKIVTK